MGFAGHVWSWVWIAGVVVLVQVGKSQGHPVLMLFWAVLAKGCVLTTFGRVSVWSGQDVSVFIRHVVDFSFKHVH